MTNSNVRFRAGPLLEEFIAVLAEHGHATVKELHEMFSSCILCLDYATFAAVGLDRNAWFAESQPGISGILVVRVVHPLFRTA